MKFCVKCENSNVYFFYNIVAVIAYAVLFGFTIRKGLENSIFYIAVLAGFIGLSLSATEGIKATFFKNMLIEGLFLILLSCASIIYICVAFSMMPRVTDNWLLGFVATIMMLLPQCIHFWRLIHISETMPKILLVSIGNVLILEFMLYYGLGMTILSEKNIDYSLLCGNLFDKIMLVINIGMSAVTQLPEVGNGNLPSTRLILAYCIGNFINFIIASFLVAYAVSMLTELKNKNDKNTVLCKKFK